MNLRHAGALVGWVLMLPPTADDLDSSCAATASVPDMLNHGFGHGAGICPVDPMTLMIALLLNWLGGHGFPPGSGVGPKVCSAP